MEWDGWEDGFNGQEEKLPVCVIQILSAAVLTERAAESGSQAPFTKDCNLSCGLLHSDS